jgi:cell volume regulation protein A
MGWGIKKATEFLKYELPDFSSFLPVIATVGLVLIVFEGSLELKLNKSKISLIKKSFLGALLSIVTLSLMLSYAFQYVGGSSFKTNMLNAIPLCIISSAIAIPSIRNLSKSDGEFVIYESSLSDILGVLFFNFIALNQIITLHSFGQFGIQLVIIAFVSLAATIGLSLLLSKIDHHVKFIPIILLIILIYAVANAYHLPALLFILIFGLTIGNIGWFKRFNWFLKLKTDVLQQEINKLKELTIEGAFLIRALFFILFGYLLKTEEIVNRDTILWSLAIVFLVVVLRVLQLKISRLPLKPLLFVAPRGLITILLFISIVPADNIPLVNNSLIIQVIILSTLLMTIGLMVSSKKEKSDSIIE